MTEQFISVGMSAVQTQGKRLAKECALHRVNCLYYDEKSKTPSETSYGFFNKELAMTCLEQQRLRPECVSAEYLDPSAPPKAESFD